MAVEKHYVFEGPKGKASLLDLFEGRRQLIVYRAFFEPGVHGWPDHACRGCSMVADQVSHLAHLNARDTTLAFASRAPQAGHRAAEGADGLGRCPGTPSPTASTTTSASTNGTATNVFIRDGDRVFRTYFINNRGDEADGEHLELPRHHARSAARRCGKTRRRAIRRRRRTSGGTGTTSIRRAQVESVVKDGRSRHRTPGAQSEDADRKDASSEGCWPQDAQMRRESADCCASSQTRDRAWPRAREADRFGQIVVHVGVEAAFAIAFDGVRRHRDDRQPRRTGRRGAGADCLRRGVAVEPRHLHVHQHDIERIRLQPIERLLPIVDNNRLMPELPQHRDRDALIHRIVFGKQDAQPPPRHAHASGAAPTAVPVAGWRWRR